MVIVAFPNYELPELVDYCLVQNWHYRRTSTAISIPVTVCIYITRNVMLKMPQAGNDCFCLEWTQSYPHCSVWLSPKKKHAHIRNGHEHVQNTFLDEQQQWQERDGRHWKHHTFIGEWFLFLLLLCSANNLWWCKLLVLAGCLKFVGNVVCGSVIDREEKQNDHEERVMMFTMA